MDDAADLDFTRHHDLTVEEVKGCPEFSHLTESQALEVIDTLKSFTKIVYDCYTDNMKKS